jgi:hypothetical protein
MQIRSHSDLRGPVTLLDLVSAVMDVTPNEREVTAVVVDLLRTGSVRLHGVPELR